MRLKRSWRAAFVLASAVAALLLLATPSHAVMDWPALLSRPHPQPTRRIAYGADRLQYADLWLPEGKGPFRPC